MMMSLEKGEMDATCKENICHLPMQDIIWILGMEQSTDKDLELNISFLTLRDDKGVQLRRCFIDSSTSLKISQIYELVRESIWKPPRGKSRRPRCLTFANQDLFDCVKSNSELFSEMKISIFYGEKLTEFEDMKNSLTYQCNSCNMRGTCDCFNLCSRMCKAVRYCSEECCEADWKGLSFGGIYHSHQVWCSKIQVYMEAVGTLKDLPFSFIEETSSVDFTFAKYKEFLIQHGVYNFGAWRYEDCSNVNVISEFGDLAMLDFPLILTEEKQLQSTDPITAPIHPLTNWQDYYEWRDFDLNCPLAILLTYPLTLYYIITSCLHVHYSCSVPQILVIHILGAEKEADMFEYFLELCHLLPSQKLEIHLFGNKISRKAHGFKKTQHNLTFYLHRKLWHKFDSSDPHVTIGFNAGLAAYKSWTQTLKKLTEKEIPAYFTDYCHYSHDWSADHLQLLQLNAKLVQPYINPFRSPVRKFCDEHCIPSYSNAFLSHLHYSDKDTTMK